MSHHLSPQFGKLKPPWRKRSTSLQVDELSRPGKMKSKEEPSSSVSREDDGLVALGRRRTYTIGSHDPAHLPRVSVLHHAAILVKQDSLPVDCPQPVRLRRTGSGESLDVVDSGQNSPSNPSSPAPSIDCDTVTAFLVDDPELAFSQLLHAHCCYDAVPNNNKLVIFDTTLPVKKAFFALIYNCVRSALICDNKTNTLVGILSITDFIRILLRFYKKTRSNDPMNNSSGNLNEASHAVEKSLEEHEIGSWREILKRRGCVRPLITLDANQSLFKAAQVLANEGIHRIPIVDPLTRNPLYILTYKRLLKFMWIFGARLPRPAFFDIPPRELGIGKWGADVTTVYPESPLVECLDLFLERGISGIPVVSRGGRVVDMYTRFDAIGIAAQGRFDNLEISVEEALQNRKDSQDFEGVVRCLETENLWSVIDRVVSAEVHRIVIVDKEDRLAGLVTMSNIIRHLVLRPKIQKESGRNSGHISPITEQRVEGVKEEVIHIGGIFPMNAEGGGWAGGAACLPAAEMALKDVNRQRVIKGYHLKMHNKDSGCQPGLGAKMMYELLYNAPPKLMLLAGCSLVTTVVAEAAPMWQLLVLAYGASSPALSNRDRFPTLFRTHPSATIHNPTRIRMFKEFKWSNISILQSVEELFTSTAKDLEKQSQKSGINVISRQSFYGDPADAVKSLRRQDARIIVGLFYEKDARKVFCQAYKEGLYGRRYVWFLIGWYADNWFLPKSKEEESLNCTEAEMKQATQYHFTTEAIMLNQDKENTTKSGMTSDEFMKKLTEELKTAPNVTDGFVEAPLAYDAIWALALAFNCTIKELAKKRRTLSDYSYENNVIPDDVSKIYQACMLATEFAGVSGIVKFQTTTGDRIAKTKIEQLQDSNYIPIGTYDTEKKSLEWKRESVKFVGGKPPPDSTREKEKLLTVKFGLYVCVALMCALGVFSAAALIAFNHKNKYRRFIAQSQPQCNNITLAGCILCFLSLLLFGLPAEGLPVHQDTFSLLCHSRVSMLILGFSLAFGAMFAKVWLLYRLGAAEHMDPASKEQVQPGGAIAALAAAAVGPRSAAAYTVRQKLRKISENTYYTIVGRRKSLAINQIIPVWKYYSVLGILIGLDMVILVAWTFLDPMYRHKEKFSLEDPPPGAQDDITYRPVLEHCMSRHQSAWIGVIFAYKGLLLLFGLFLAYESRNLKLRQINDSRFVSLAIYNVAVLSLITGPVVVLLIKSQQNANFSFIAVTVLLCAWISMGLIFLPKVLFVWRVPPTAAEGSAKEGHSSNKLTKEEEEKYKRLLLENEEIKKQIAEKEARIAQLRKRLEKRMEEAAAEKRVSTQELHIRGKVSNESRGDVEEEKPQALQSTNLVTTQASIETVQKENTLASPDEHLPSVLHQNENKKVTEDSGYKSSTNSGTGLGSIPLTQHPSHPKGYEDQQPLVSDTADIFL